MTYLIVIFVMAVSFCLSSYAASIKRGFVASGCSATGLGVCSDDLLLPGLQYYSYKPTNDFPNPPDPDLFTPMVWCSATLETPVPLYVKRPYVMIGFNEPDSITQCGISPLVAAERYGTLMRLNPPPNQLTSPSCASGDTTWYKNFFIECKRLYPSEPRCGITIMNVHYYVCNIDSLMRHLNKIHDEFGMPIYLTEWACNLPSQNTSVSIQKDYMQRAVEILEVTPWVLMYYWFRSHIPANNGLIDVIRGTEVIADLGSFYLSLPYPEEPTPSPSPSLTPSLKSTATFTIISSSSPTASPSRTPSRTPTRSLTQSRTPSHSKTPSRSPTKTPPTTSTASQSRTPTRSHTKTPSSTRTKSTPSRTPSSTSSRRQRRNRTR
jgi:hypothetical protein